MATPANGRKFKVRTGCITCKIRKIKCDEIKPACLRCTSTGRKCDGYTKVNAEDSEVQRRLVSSQASRGSGRSNALFADVAALSGAASADEHRWLEYFSQHAGPALSDLADKDFWAHVLPQLSVSEPAIRHALLAVGSSHARFEVHAKIKGAMGAIEHDHSIKHYNSAVLHLRRSLLQAPADVTVPLICCLLFICLECLYGNEPLMMDHLKNGLRILTSVRSNSTDVTAMRFIKQKLERIFCRLDTQSTLSGKPVFLQSGDPTLAFNLEIPSTFNDVVEAKMYLDTINAMSLSFIRLNIDETFGEKYPNCSATLLRGRLQERFIAWRNALDEFERESSPKDIDHKITATRLRVEYHASFIYLSNCLEPEESSYDAYIPQFANLISLARSVLPSPEESESDGSELASLFITPKPMTPSTKPSPVHSTGFSLEASLIPSLYLTAVKCRDPIIRRDAVSLLGRNNGREGLWDARMNWRVARKLVEIEERGMLMYQGAAEAFMEEAPSMRMQASNGAVLTDLPCERFRVTSGGVFRDFEAGTLSSARVTFCTRPNGVSEEEHVLVEELWL